MIKNHNNYLSIPYKVPHFVLSRGEEREWNTREGTEMKKEWHHRGRKANVNYHMQVSRFYNPLNRINCNEKIDVTVQVDS